MTGLDFLLQIACSSSSLLFVLFDKDGNITATNHAMSDGKKPKTLAELSAFGNIKLLTDRAALSIPDDAPHVEDTLRVLNWFIQRCHDAGEDKVRSLCSLLHSGTFQPTDVSLTHLLRLLFQTSQLVGFIGERDEPIYETKNISIIYNDHARIAEQLLYDSKNRLTTEPTSNSCTLHLCRFVQLQTTLSCLISTAMTLADGDAHMIFDSNELAVWVTLSFPCARAPKSLDPMFALPSPDNPRDLSLPIIGEAIRTYGGSLVLRSENGVVELTLTLHPKIYSFGDAFFLRGASELAPSSSIQLAIELGDLLA